MGNVIPAVEIIVDEHLPVAMNLVHPAIEVMQLAHAEGRHSLDESAKEVLQRRSVRVEIHEHELFPYLGFHR
jgi:hypothetical protein